MEITANSEDRVMAAKDVFIEKLIRRGLSMKMLDLGEPMASGKGFRLVGSLKQGIDKENAKKITKLLRDEGPKGVKAQIQGEEIRVSSKKRDDLQECIALLKGADFEVALQFTNATRRGAPAPGAPGPRRSPQPATPRPPVSFTAHKRTRVAACRNDSTAPPRGVAQPATSADASTTP